MASFGVTITTNTTPAIVTSLSVNTTYAQFKNSLGFYVYQVQEIYLYSELLKQIQGGFKYLKYDSNGTQNSQTILSVIDPFQSFSSIFIDTSDKNLVFDGRDNVKFNMLPNAKLQIKFYCYRISNAQSYDLVGNNEFYKHPFMEEYNFFDDYKDLL
jgi:hypothetical protein